ncbi:MAG: cupin domain-containing protein [Candidatus Acidiferrales bacterium]
MTIPRGLCALVLFLGAVALVGSATVQAQNAKGPMIHMHSALKFGPLPNLPACVTGASEQGNPMSEASTLLLHFRAGCSVPWHWHTPEETLMIVSGTIRAGMKGESKPMFLHQGDYAALPSHNVHQARCVGTVPCTVFLQSSGAFDIHYVDSAGKEIPLSEAVKPAVKARAKMR